MDQSSLTRAAAILDFIVKKIQEDHYGSRFVVDGKEVTDNDVDLMRSVIYMLRAMEFRG